MSNKPNYCSHDCGCMDIGEVVCTKPTRQPLQFVVGKQYTHKDGRTLVFLCVHPHDGAYYLFEDVDGPDEDRPNFFGCERFDVGPLKHDLYTDADPARPTSICDRNGQVTLGLCKRCGKGESELFNEDGSASECAEKGAACAGPKIGERKLEKATPKTGGVEFENNPVGMLGGMGFLLGPGDDL